MKLFPALRYLTIALQIPVLVLSSEVPAWRLAKPFVGQTQRASQTLPFSTAAQLQARNSKGPKRDPRISPSPSKAFFVRQTERMSAQG